MNVHVIKDIVHSHRAFILYCLIGVCGATLDYVSFLVLYNHFGMAPLLATTLSISIGITNNFFLNRAYNFKVHDKMFRRFLMFYAVGVSGIFISIIIIYTLSDVMSVDPNVSKLISIPVVTAFQYLLNSRVSFAAQR